MTYKKFIWLPLFYFLLLFSCSRDNNSSTEQDTILIMCSDQILNGDEEKIDCGGSCDNVCDTNSPELQGILTGHRILDPNIDYIIEEGYILESGATLVIPEGTNITAEAGDDIYILVKKGADIVIKGTSTAPVIINTKGAWAGIIIAGNSHLSPLANGSASIGMENFEYGGNDPSENSGTIEYLVIKNAGNTTYGALSMFAVGSGTTLRNIAIFNSNTYGIKYYGGTVSASNVYLENNQEIGIAWTEGWNGNQTDTYIANNSGFSYMVGANGVNNNPNLSNITAITNQNGIAFRFSDQSGANITNLSLSGVFEPSFLLLDDVINQNIQIEGQNVDTNRSYDSESQLNVNNFNWAGNLIRFE